MLDNNLFRKKITNLIKTRSRVFYLLLLDFVFAILLASYFEEFLAGEVFRIILGVFLGFIFVIIFYKHYYIRLVFLIILFFFLGIFRFVVFIDTDPNADIRILEASKHSIEARILNNPETGIKNQQFIIETYRINGQDIKKNVLVFARLYPKFSYGDFINPECELQRPEPIEDFRYDKYLEMKKINFLCYYPEINNNQKKERFLFLETAYSLKNNFKKTINDNISEPGASIINAMLTGDKKMLSDDLKLNFSKTGLSHIIAISGMHIGIIIFLLGYMFYTMGFSRKLIFYQICISLLFYNILIGFPASALRASLMGLIILYLFKIGRINNIKQSVIIAGFFMVLANPLSIRYDTGFIYSFLALLGIVYFYPRLDSFLKTPEKRILKYIRDVFLVSISAQIFIFPLIVNNFGIVSFSFPLMNVLVLWSLPIILVGAILSYFLTFIFPIFSQFIFAPLSFLIFSLLHAVNFFAGIDILSMEIEVVNQSLIILYYLTILILVFYNSFLKKDSFSK